MKRPTKYLWMRLDDLHSGVYTMSIISYIDTEYVNLLS